jgi:E3 ubiquitin-protein ligase UBR7
MFASRVTPFVITAMSTLNEILASQEDLIREASLALPHDFKHCTYRLGPLRQAVFLCLTCSSNSERRGICSACSIACHTDHEQLELFPKRNFRCDCPTAALSHRCTLHTTAEEENKSNQYGQNFHALFCRCGRSYDAKTERETMIQCLACEVCFYAFESFKS